MPPWMLSATPFADCAVDTRVTAPVLDSRSVPAS